MTFNECQKSKMKIFIHMLHPLYLLHIRLATVSLFTLLDTTNQSSQVYQCVKMTSITLSVEHQLGDVYMGHQRSRMKITVQNSRCSPLFSSRQSAEHGS